MTFAFCVEDLFSVLSIAYKTALKHREILAKSKKKLGLPPKMFGPHLRKMLATGLQRTLVNGGSQPARITSESDGRIIALRQGV